MKTWLAIAGIIAAFAGAAEAGILVAPTRLVLEAGARHGEFILVNKGERTERYRISLEGRRMGPDGRLQPVESPAEGDRFAHELIRFAPRVVVLPPEEPQMVRILVRNPGDLPIAEYRSHLVFRQVPEAPPAAPEPSAGAERRGLSVKIQPIFGVSVPIIVRHGRLRAEGALSELGLGELDDVPSLRLRLAREGDRSLFGDFTVTHEQPGAQPRVVGRANHVALYTPNRERPVEIPLQALEGPLPRRGRLVVEYRDAESDESELIAESALDLAGP